MSEADSEKKKKKKEPYSLFWHSQIQQEEIDNRSRALLAGKPRRYLPWCNGCHGTTSLTESCLPLIINWCHMFVSLCFMGGGAGILQTERFLINEPKKSSRRESGEIWTLKYEINWRHLSSEILVRWKSLPSFGLKSNPSKKPADSKQVKVNGRFRGTCCSIFRLEE
jgi:hypothetical protein